MWLLRVLRHYRHRSVVWGLTANETAISSWPLMAIDTHTHTHTHTNTTIITPDADTSFCCSPCFCYLVSRAIIPLHSQRFCTHTFIYLFIYLSFLNCNSLLFPSSQLQTYWRAEGPEESEKRKRKEWASERVSKHDTGDRKERRRCCVFPSPTGP